MRPCDPNRSPSPSPDQAVEGDFLKLSVGAAGALRLPAFDAAFDRGGLVAVEQP